MPFTNKDIDNLQFMIDLGFEPYNFDKRADGIWYLRNNNNTVQKIVIGKDKGTMDLLIDFGSYSHKYYPDCSYKTKEDVDINFKLFKKVIIRDLDRYNREDHVSGNINEDIYNNYRRIADSIKFKPQTINELNEYAIKLKYERKISFEDYIKHISSLYIVMLLDIFDFNKLDFLYDKNEKYNYRRLFVKKMPSYERSDNMKQYDEELVIIQPTLEAEKLWNDKIVAITCKIFEKDEKRIDNFNISKILKEYRQIAKSVNFEPKNIDELNDYAIKLRDDRKISFENYVKQISSLYISLLLDVYKFHKAEYSFDHKNEFLLKTLNLEINVFKEPPYIRSFENSMKYCEDFNSIQIVDEVTELYYKQRYELGNEKLNKIYNGEK